MATNQADVKAFEEETLRPQFHYTALKGSIGSLIDFYRANGQWHVTYEYRVGEEAGADPLIGYARSKDLIHWHEEAGPYEQDTTPRVPRLFALPVRGAEHDQQLSKWIFLHDDGTYELGQWHDQQFVAERARETLLWHGSPSDWLVCEAEGRCLLIGTGQLEDDLAAPPRRQLLLPAELQLRQTERGGLKLYASPVEELQRLRVWHRKWSGVELDGSGSGNGNGDGSKQGFEESLRFRLVPGEWPDVRLLPPEGKPDDIGADSLDVQLALETDADSLVHIEVYGVRIRLDRSLQTIACGGVVAPLTPTGGIVRLRLLLDRASLELYACDGEVAMSVPVRPSYNDRTLRLSDHRGHAKAASVNVYGLRGIWPSAEERRLIEPVLQDDTVIYQSASYTVYKHRIEDAVYGEPPAYVPDRDTIVSPTRAVEDFKWQRSDSNDMTRVIDRGPVWHPQREISMLPDVHTGIPTFDAAYRLAADIFYRCGSKEFARPGEEGMWSAGQFQGPGEGFGVWVRDTTHIAIRMGSILDPEGARRSLLFTTMDGFDNGVDGTAMPIVGIWDYYLATGDLTLIEETWANLKRRIAKLDGTFDPVHGLIPADQATSNDHFQEPENGGFSFVTEIYFMEAFRAIARMGVLMGEPEEQVKAWAERGEQLLRNIQRLYWNSDAGIFTTGPVGSEGNLKGYWESAGQEIAMWPRYGIATSEQRRSMLDRLPEVAMNEFGVNVFPYRPETNHFCNAAWVVWTSGMAATAGREGRLDLLMTFISQQVRNGVMNKTFYEVIDYNTGKAWRWPGQLWHAAGFISYFFLGLLGMEYDEQGLSFAPAIPEELRDLQVDNLRYREAQLHIRVHGWGTKFTMVCDGKPIERIPTDLKGEHVIEIQAAP
ncbi:GH32 C-terminal domain-containing protein [Paenibacillus silvisoli]|uniref:GH32 C-terminal domain-containing protein n=1 Tax=Paenibacillus silvisoli TaxID=3110539 RepID=UPI0028061E2F|nr:GH32 C-terminal domain-containing protein [Paenibacillus silvisoli]